MWRKLFRLVQLSVAERIVQEGLVPGAGDERDPVHLDALLLQVADGGIDVVDSDREVVCTERLGVGFHQVDLLAAGVEPVPGAEIGARELRHAEHVPVEGESLCPRRRRWRMVYTGWLHRSILLSRRAASAVPLRSPRLARYRMSWLLGPGGMGEVYLVRNPRLAVTTRWRCCPRISPPGWVRLSGYLRQPSISRAEPQRWHDICRSGAVPQGGRGVEASRFRSGWDEVAAKFVQGSVTYEDQEPLLLRSLRTATRLGNVVDEAVRYDENTDAFVIRTAQ